MNTQKKAVSNDLTNDAIIAVNLMLAERAVLIRPACTPVEVEPLNNSNFELNQLYKLIDCRLIDVVQIPNPETLQYDGKYIMIVDDEGLLANRPVLNLLATVLRVDTGEGITREQVNALAIAGNAIICPSDMLK